MDAEEAVASVLELLDQVKASRHTSREVRALERAVRARIKHGSPDTGQDREPVRYLASPCATCGHTYNHHASTGVCEHAGRSGAADVLCVCAQFVDLPPLNRNRQPAPDLAPAFAMHESPNLTKAREMLADPEGYFERARREAAAAERAARSRPALPPGPHPLTLLRFTMTAASILWALVVSTTVLAVTVEPGAINAALGIGVVALLSTGFVVTEWIERRRDRKRGRTS